MSVKEQVLFLLSKDKLSKSDISEIMGQKMVSGQLHTAIKELLDSKTIEYTIPDKPKSKFQKYRLV